MFIDTANNNTEEQKIETEVILWCYISNLFRLFIINFIRQRKIIILFKFNLRIY